MSASSTTEKLVEPAHHVGVPRGGDDAAVAPRAPQAAALEDVRVRQLQGVDDDAAVHAAALRRRA